jgi:hypothetical protein
MVEKVFRTRKKDAGNGSEWGGNRGTAEQYPARRLPRLVAGVGVSALRALWPPAGSSEFVHTGIFTGILGSAGEEEEAKR